MNLRLMGNDLVIVDAQIFADFGHGEIGKLTFEADITTMKRGKNGNATVAYNATGEQATLELRVLRGGSDDTFLNKKLTKYLSDPTTFVAMDASITKVLGTGVDNGTGTGKVINDVYQLSFGVFKKQVEMVMNVEGDVEQALSVYTMSFAVASRVID